MIPTQCPSGQDPRMCAYCDQKDTCGCTCEDTTDAIWGKISGDLADQTDLVAELDNRETAVRSDITANTNLITSLQTLTSQVESTANSALAIGDTNTKRLDATEGVANTAKTLASANEKRLTETEGVANNASALAKTNATRLTATEGVANTAKALADSNAKRLTSTEGVANGADALSKENRKLISTVEARANEIEIMHYIPWSLEFITVENTQDQLYAVVPLDYGEIIRNNSSYCFLFARNVHTTAKLPIGRYKQTGWRSPRISHDIAVEYNLDAYEYPLLQIVPNRDKIETVKRLNQQYYRIPLRLYSAAYAAGHNMEITTDPKIDLTLDSHPDAFWELEDFFEATAAKYGDASTGHSYTHLCYKKMGIALAFHYDDGGIYLRSDFKPFTVYFNKNNQNFSFSRWTDFTTNPGTSPSVLLSDDSGIAVVSEDDNTTTDSEESNA